MWSFILSVLIAFQAKYDTHVVAEGNFRSAIVKTKENKKMIGQSIRRIQVTDLYECAQCLIAKTCQSFNYNQATRDCYLSNITASSSKEELIYSKEYVYGYSFQTKEVSSGYPPRTCSELKMKAPSTPSDYYIIDPDSQSGEAPFLVYCNMTDKGGVGVTVVSHDSEVRTLVDGYGPAGSYVKDVKYNASVSQLARLTEVSGVCQQFIKFECKNDVSFIHEGQGWWVSRDSKRQDYWGGAAPGSRKCACGMTSTCENNVYGCNCYNGGQGWRSDSGFLTDKSSLPVIQLRFGDTDQENEQAYHTLGKLTCYGNV